MSEDLPIYYILQAHSATYEILFLLQGVWSSKLAKSDGDSNRMCTPKSQCREHPKNQRTLFYVVEVRMRNPEE